MCACEQWQPYYNVWSFNICTCLPSQYELLVGDSNSYRHGSRPLFLDALVCSHTEGSVSQQENSNTREVPVAFLNGKLDTTDQHKCCNHTTYARTTNMTQRCTVLHTVSSTTRNLHIIELFSHGEEVHSQRFKIYSTTAAHSGTHRHTHTLTSTVPELFTSETKHRKVDRQQSYHLKEKNNQWHTAIRSVSVSCVHVYVCGVTCSQLWDTTHPMHTLWLHNTHCTGARTLSISHLCIQSTSWPVEYNSWLAWFGSANYQMIVTRLLVTLCMPQVSYSDCIQ